MSDHDNEIDIEEDEDGIDPEIAAAMGFSSFGAKRRKHTARTDVAVVAGNASTGANEVALGVRSRVGGGGGKGEVRQARTQTQEQAQAQGLGNTGELKDSGENGGMGYTGTQIGEVPGVAGQGQGVQSQEMGAQGVDGWAQGWPSAEELAALRRGIRNAKGDMVVFLPGFVEDPWKGLK